MSATHNQDRAPEPTDAESSFNTRQPALHSPRPTTPDLDPPGADKLGLTTEEIDQFREFGYVIKRGLIPTEVLSSIIDLWWQQPPVLAAKMQRDDPGTWVFPGRHWPKDNRWGLAKNWMGSGPWPTPDEPRAGADIGERVGRLPHKLTRDITNDVWRWHGIGHDPAFVAATSAHPNVLHMAEALMGGPVKRPHRNRGIYSVFPHNDSDPGSKLGPHTDNNMTEMMVVTYLNDVEPRGGGFTIFPTSPQSLYPTSAQALNWVATESSKTVMDDIMVNVQPIEFTGKAGDVIFCHGWVVHSAGIHESSRIRMAAVQDFNKVKQRSHLRWSAAGKHGGPRVHCNMDGVFNFPTNTNDDPADGQREVTTLWMIDSNEFLLDKHAPGNDPFDEWNLGQHPVVGHVVDELPWWDKYNLPLLPTGNVPRGGGGIPAVPLSEIASYEGDGCWRVVSRANDWM